MASTEGGDALGEVNDDDGDVVGGALVHRGACEDRRGDAGRGLQAQRVTSCVRRVSGLMSRLSTLWPLTLRIAARSNA